MALSGGLPTKKAEKHKESKLRKEILTVLREKANEFEERARVAEARVAALENAQAKVFRAQVAAEADAEALLNAVRLLSEFVPSDLAAPRKAREEARHILELRKIRPPATLGASRNKKSKKRRS